MDQVELLVESASRLLAGSGMTKPRIVVVLGSGLGSFVDRLCDVTTVPTSAIPGFPKSTVPGHAGRIHFGRVRHGRRLSPPLLVFQGRIHPYEGGNPDFSTLNIQISKALGTRIAVLTNAAGGIHPDMRPGDLMLHENIIAIPQSLRHRPLPPAKHPITSFHDGPYDASLQTLVEDAARDLGERMLRGVYCYLPGPTYETPAEVRMLRRIGADAVGMSTYPEVLAARGLGIPAVAISLISNQAAGLSGHVLSHTDVTESAAKAGSRLGSLLSRFLTIDTA